MKFTSTFSNLNINLSMKNRLQYCNLMQNKAVSVFPCDTAVNLCNFPLKYAHWDVSPARRIYCNLAVFKWALQEFGNKISHNIISPWFDFLFCFACLHAPMLWKQCSSALYYRLFTKQFANEPDLNRQGLNLKLFFVLIKLLYRPSLKTLFELFYRILQKRGF